MTWAVGWRGCPKILTLLIGLSVAGRRIMDDHPVPFFLRVAEKALEVVAHGFLQILKVLQANGFYGFITISLHTSDA